MRDNWGHTCGPERHVCTQLSTVDGSDMSSQMDIHTCTNACTHSHQAVGQKGFTGTCTLGHTGVHML